MVVLTKILKEYTQFVDAFMMSEDCNLQGDSAKCAQILFLVLCTCILSIINFQLLTF